MNNIAVNDTVLLNVAGGVAEITLNRPRRMNAMDADMRAAFAQVVSTIEMDSTIRSVILHGAGGNFCSGGDISSINDDPDGAAKRMRLITLHKTLSALMRLDCPVITAVDGVAYGAGLGLAAAGDILLATPGARFCASFLRIGMIPDLGVLYTLPRLVGLQRAKELVFSTREINAAEAKDIGLALEVYPAPDILERARALARGFAKASPTAMSLTKRGLNRSLESDLATMLAIEADSQGIAYQTTEARQALQAFLKKRSSD